MKNIRILAGGLCLLALAALAGCNQPAPPSKDGKKGNEPNKKEDDHSHGAGPHGGAVADWGGGKYHIEFTVSHPKKEARVYILVGDAKKAAPIKAKDGQLTVNSM